MEGAMSTSSKGLATVSNPVVEPPNDLPKIAALETELVESLGVPLSTYRACTRGGRGPRTFKIGRRNYVLLADWDAWLETLAATGGLTAVEQ